MRLLFLFLIIGINSHAVELACDNVNESIMEKITDLVKESYSKVQFAELTIDALGSELPTDCDYVSFQFPKKVDLSSDLIIRFDAHKNDLFQKRSTRIFRFKGFANVLRASKILHRGDDVSEKSVVSGKIKLNKVNQHTVSSITPMAYQYRNYIDKDQIIEKTNYKYRKEGFFDKFHYSNLSQTYLPQEIVFEKFLSLQSHLNYLVYLNS